MITGKPFGHLVSKVAILLLLCGLIKISGSCFQVVHGFSILLLIGSTAQQNGHISSVVRAAAEHTSRQVQALQLGSEASWEVAEVSLSRIKLLLDSIPPIPELQDTTRLFVNHDNLTSLGGPSDPDCESGSTKRTEPRTYQYSYDGLGRLQSLDQFDGLDDWNAIMGR